MRQGVEGASHACESTSNRLVHVRNGTLFGPVLDVCLRGREDARGGSAEFLRTVHEDLGRAPAGLTAPRLGLTNQHAGFLCEGGVG